jgi:adenosylhomocysteine nucleosidase
MEGAAIAQVCYQQRVPFIVIRSMSDNADERARIDVERFYQAAADNSAKLVMALVEMLNTSITQ